MEGYNTTVRMSGFVLSSMMFHHLNSDADVEGLVLGESVGEENCRITDSQIDQIQVEHTINIQKHVPCRKLHSFYSNVGAVSEEKIRHILSDYKEENVIGWYRERRNTSQQMSFMERVIHQNMRKILSNQELVFLLLTPSQATSSGSTHRLEFSAFIWHSSQFLNIPVSVSNLGNLEQQDYWSVSTVCPSLGQSQAVNQHRSNFFYSGDDLNEVRNVSDMNDALLAEMQKMCTDVEKSERAVEKLQKDISRLNEDLRKQKHSENNESQKCASPDEPKENVLLCSALRTLFPDAPSLRTQTLTVQGFPVLKRCCNTDHNVDIPTKLPLVLKTMNVDQAPRLRKKSLVTGFSERLKRKRNTNDAASESGSDTEIEMNGESRSNSPTF
ncbi:BRCA1-A complex subunit Abraxas 1 [Misgurnus anguillicaudatus]|uniref:BRCA1-A complex subunit Abraxas 1 n=1 Tax=Misgurnus anguillicaudatus TaxID=75329 RepID=UPI003CCF0619